MDRLNKINFLQQKLAWDIYQVGFEEGNAPSPPPGTDAILQDNGDYLLQDNNDNLLQG